MRDCNAGYQFLKVPKMSTVIYIPKVRQVETSMNTSNTRWSVVVLLFVSAPARSLTVEQWKSSVAGSAWNQFTSLASNNGSDLSRTSNRRPKPYCAYGPHNSTGTRSSALVCKILGRGSLLRSLTSDLCACLVVDG